MEIADWLVAVGILTALFVGVGGWIYDFIQRRRDLRRRKESFAVLVAEDVRLARSQGRDIRTFLEEVQHAKGHEVDGKPFIYFKKNQFANLGKSLMFFTPMKTVESSSDWAMFMEPEIVQRVSSIRNCIHGWNEKAATLIERPKSDSIKGDIASDLVFILDRVESISTLVHGELIEIVTKKK